MAIFRVAKLGLVSLAILCVSFQTTQVNALSAERSEHQKGENYHHKHQAAPKKPEHHHGHSGKKHKASNHTHKPTKHKGSQHQEQHTAHKHKHTEPKHQHKTPHHDKPTHNDKPAHHDEPAHHDKPAAPVSHGNTPERSKSGLVWGGGPDQLPSYAARKGMLLYNWAVDPPYNAKQLGFEYMPMLWGYRNVQGGCQYNGGCFSKIKAGDYKTVMFINEPNEHGQANMSPEEAVKLWHRYMQPLANQGVRTVGPVMSSNPNGFVWTKKFYEICGNCKVDLQPIHYYDLTSAGFIKYVEKYYNAFKKPIIVTEWACQNYNKGRQATAEEIWTFNTEVVHWMENTPYVEHYFAFGAMNPPLPDGVNQLNILMQNGKPNALARLVGL